MNEEIPQLEAEQFLTKLSVMKKRREEATETSNWCPRCGVDQIQLVSWIEDIKWKCRECGYKWER